MRLRRMGLAAALVLSLGGMAIAAIPPAVATAATPAASPAAAPAATSSAAAPATDYEIKLIRPMKVGAEYHMAAAILYEDKGVLKEGDLVLNEETTRTAVDFAATVKIVEVDRNGSPRKFTLTVEKCVLSAASSGKYDIAKGTVILALVNGAVNDTDYEIGGEPVSDAIRHVLGLAVDVGNVPFASYDEVLGARQRKKVGDKWDVNVAAFTKRVEQRGLFQAKEDIRGTATLAGITKVDGTECQDIRAEVTIGKYADQDPAPPGFNRDKSTVQMHFGLKAPVDVSQNVLEESSDQTRTTVIRGRPDPEKPEMVMERVYSECVTRRFTPAK